MPLFFTLLAFLSYIQYIHTFLHPWTFARLLSIPSSLIRSVADTSLGCRVGIQTRACLTASRRVLYINSIWMCVCCQIESKARHLYTLPWLNGRASTYIQRGGACSIPGKFMIFNGFFKLYFAVCVFIFPFFWGTLPCGLTIILPVSPKRSKSNTNCVRIYVRICYFFYSHL